jgi:hypothetical protein
MTELVRTIAHPTTGELTTLDAPAPELADELEHLRSIRANLGAFERRIVEELAHRADLQNKRTVEVDGVCYVTNAPTEDAYMLEDVQRELGVLVDAGELDKRIVESLVRYPQPAGPPPPALDRRRLAALLKTDDRKVLAALARARRRRTNTRTVRIIARAVDATATEEAS